MFYMFFDELKKIEKNEAKKIYNEANSRFIENERWLYRFLIFFMLFLQVLGGWLGGYFYNSTHLFIYTGFTGALIGFIVMMITMRKKLKGYIKLVINESNT